MRLPALQKCSHIFWAKLSRGLEFPLFLAENEFAVRVKNGQAGDAFIERDSVLFGEVQILVVLPDVDVNHMIVLVDEWGDSLRAERCVQNVAVVAPVPSEYQDDALVILPSRS